MDVSPDEEDELDDTISPLGGEMTFDDTTQKFRVSTRVDVEHRALNRTAASGAGTRNVFQPQNSRSDPLAPEVFLDGKDSPRQLTPVRVLRKAF